MRYKIKGLVLPLAVIGIFSLGFLHLIFPNIVKALSTISWDSHTLSQNRGGMATTTVDGKVFLAGGYQFSDGTTSKLIEIYDSSSSSWSIDYLPESRREFAATNVGSKALFGGGWSATPYTIVRNSVDIYNSLTGRWSQASLSTSRDSLAATSVDCKAIFAGGKFSPATFSTVDIYDSIQDTWSVSSLSTPRYALAATSAYGKAYFAGGYNLGTGHISNVVDIYDSTSNSWSTAFLSIGRKDIGAASVGNKVLFAGGDTGNGETDVVDIYDTTTNTWSVTHMPSPREYVVAMTVGDLVFIMGGSHNQVVDSRTTIDIYNATSNTWTTEATPRLRGNSAVGVSVGAKAIFAGELLSKPFNPLLPDTADIAEVSPQPMPEPNIAALLDITHQISGKNLSGTGLIRDGDSCNWLVKVDYGDGSGFQNLTRDGYNFVLDHHYYNEGYYTITVVGIDDHRNETTRTFDVVLSNTFPVVSEITVSTVLLPVGSTVLVGATFSDTDTGDTHSAVWDWGDGSNSTGVVTESNGNGSIAGSHVYVIPGVYTVILTVADNDGASIQAIYEFIVVYDPNGGSVRGSGEIESPLGALSWNPGITDGARFGFRSIYQRGANIPSGNTQFTFRVADFKFVSTSYDWLVVAGAKAQYKGSGEINRQGDYGFMLTGIDGTRPGGGGVDKFRIKIWDKTDGVVIYDNQRGDGDTIDPTTLLTRGSIRISE